MNEMTTTTFTDRVGLARRTLEVFQENRAELAKKLQVDVWIDDLEAGIERAAAKDAMQEALKAELKATTLELNAIDRGLYRLTSGAIDAGAGALGKGSPPAVQLARVRSQLHRPAGASGAEVQPVAPPPQ